MGRNQTVLPDFLDGRVALYAEGVGRNSIFAFDFLFRLTVALYAEGVGRNWMILHMLDMVYRSPSTRRAWVEILPHLQAPLILTLVALYAEGVGRNSTRAVEKTTAFCVALYAEGVGRNTPTTTPMTCPLASPSTRRAWVEIIVCLTEFATI